MHLFESYHWFCRLVFLVVHYNYLSEVNITKEFVMIVKFYSRPDVKRRVIVILV